MLLQLLHHLVHVEHQHHLLIGPLHLLATFCSSTSSSLHCPLSVTSLALRSRRRCSGLAASLNSLCRRSAEALPVSESAGGVARSGAPAISWHPSLSLSRTQAVAVVCEWTESRACAPPCQLPTHVGTVPTHPAPATVPTHAPAPDALVSDRNGKIANILNSQSLDFVTKSKFILILYSGLNVCMLLGN